MTQLGITKEQLCAVEELCAWQRILEAKMPTVSDEVLDILERGVELRLEVERYTKAIRRQGS